MKNINDIDLLRNSEIYIPRDFSEEIQRKKYNKNFRFFEKGFMYFSKDIFKIKVSNKKIKHGKSYRVVIIRMYDIEDAITYMKELNGIAISPEMLTLLIEKQNELIGGMENRKFGEGMTTVAINKKTNFFPYVYTSAIGGSSLTVNIIEKNNLKKIKDGCPDYYNAIFLLEKN